MNKSVIIKNVTIALACILLLSCNSEDNSDILFAEEYPLILNAVVEQQLTRSTSTSSWDGGEEVAINIGGTVKKHTTATDGKLLVAGGTTPFYWQNQSETKTVQAWYPYSTTTPSSWSVQSDQSAGGYQHSDFLYAPSTAITFVGRESTPFKFYHQTAKVIVNIINGDAATSAGDISSVKIGDANNLALSGNYTAPSGNATQGTWSNLTDGGIVTPQELTPTGTYLKSYTFLVIPQDMAGKKFIAVTLSNGNTYYYIPQNQDAALAGGKQYTYNITVKNGYLEVEALTSGQWSNDGNETITSKTIYTADDLKPGDFYYSDGTWSDGGLRKIDVNGIGEIDTNILPTTSKTVVGIVFWTGNPTKPIHNNGTAFTDFGDPTLEIENPQCTHGLVVALQDASSAEMSWQTAHTNVGSWTNGNTSCGSIASLTQENEPMNKLRGHNNTQAIRVYHTFVENNSSSLVLPVQAIDNWGASNPSPLNSSGWYFPSEKELSLLCGRDVNDIWGNDSGGTGMRDIVNASINKVVTLATAIQLGTYWSSSENEDNNAFCVNFSNGIINNSYKQLNGHRVRSILAF